MPKNKTTSKTANGRVIKNRPASRLRIGNRKSGRSALQMTNEELIKVLTDKNKTKYKTKAMTVLNKRGVDIKAALAV